MKRYQALPQTHHWLWRAVCEARPTGGDGPDAGGSAFFHTFVGSVSSIRPVRSCTILNWLRKMRAITRSKV